MSGDCGVSCGNAAGQAEDAGHGASVLIGGGAGLEPGHLAGLLQGHVGAGWRGGSNMIAGVSSFSYAQMDAILGNWSVSRKHLGFGLLVAHWLNPSWHVDLHGLVGPAFDTLSGGVDGAARRPLPGPPVSARAGAGLRCRRATREGRELICRSDAACYETPGGFQLVLTATADVLRAGK